MSVPVFIDINVEDQVVELRGYLKSLGAEIQEENSDGGLRPNLLHVIEASGVCWSKQLNESEIETVFNSIISLILVLLSEDQTSENVIVSFCEKVSNAANSDKRAPVRVKILSNLFHGLDEHSPHRYIVFYHLVKLAGQVDQMDCIQTDLAMIKKWVDLWGVSMQKYQNLLRALQDAFQASKESEKATKIMIELLSTYTEENASQAREDAHRCIVVCLADPHTFLLDHLLQLKPVRFLEGELIHDLLSIFVSGNLDQYETFYANNKDFVNGLGLSNEENLHKMRLLTFMQMAENQKEIEFEMIQKNMKMNPEEVEDFIIDVVRSNTVQCKMDQLQQRVVINSTTHRTFARPQWQMLREKFIKWHENLTVIRNCLQTVAPETEFGKPQW